MENKLQEKPIDKPSTERFALYNLKAKNVVFDTKNKEAYIEQESKEDLILAMLIDITNRVSRLEDNLI